MELKDELSTNLTGNLEAISKSNLAYLADMFETIGEQNDMLPYQFYHTWIKDGRFDRLEKSLLKDYSIEMVQGNKTKQMLPSSFLSFKLTDYIEKMYGEKIDFKKNELLSYNKDKYWHIAFVSVSMVLCKYKLETLYKEHIIFICIKVLITYFVLYNKSGYLVSLSDIPVISKSILLTEINEFYQMAKQLGFSPVTHSEVKIERFLTKEQVMTLIEPGDSQTTIKKRIMRACPCGERKARNIMSMYGLTNQKYTRKDFHDKKGKDS